LILETKLTLLFHQKEKIICDARYHLIVITDKRLSTERRWQWRLKYTTDLR